MPDTLGVFRAPQFQSHWNPLEHAPRATRRLMRILGIPAIVWLPLLILSVVGGRAVSGVGVPFLHDYEVQTRLLIALPLYLMAEGYSDRILGSTLGSFLQRGIVREEDRARFHDILASASAWSRSPLLFVLLVGVVMMAGQLAWQRGLITSETTWYRETAPLTRWTRAGYWYGWITIPVFQFIQYRWYVRLMIWWVLLWKVSRLKLQLRPTHPDLCGGLGFLGARLYAFSPFLLAQGTVISGLLCNQIFYEHQKLRDFWQELIVFTAFVAMMVLGPLTSFSGPMIRATRRGRGEYTLLASRYVGEFERRWIRDEPFPPDKLVGSPDIQSLADLAGGYEAVRRMRPVPFGRLAVIKVAFAFAVPIAPLILTEIPLEQVLLNLVKMLL